MHASVSYNNLIFGYILIDLQIDVYRQVSGQPATPDQHSRLAALQTRCEAFLKYSV